MSVWRPQFYQKYMFFQNEMKKIRQIIMKTLHLESQQVWYRVVDFRPFWICHPQRRKLHPARMVTIARQNQPITVSLSMDMHKFKAVKGTFSIATKRPPFPVNAFRLSNGVTSCK